MQECNNSRVVNVCAAPNPVHITGMNFSPSTHLKPVVHFLALQRNILGLLAMCILVGMGERMAERFLPVYLLALSGGVLSVGVLNGLDNFLSALYSFPGGYLAERLGTKRALLVFNLLAMFGFLIVILIPRWEAVLIGACFFLSWTAISLPATMGLVASVLPRDKRTMGVSMHSLVRRFPMALGPLVGGVFIDVWGTRTGVRLAFVAALVLAGAAVWIQQTYLPEDRNEKKGEGKSPELNPFRLLVRMDPSLRDLLTADILVRFCEQIPYAFVVIWCMESIRNPISASQFGVLTAIEMATAVLIYVPVAYFADKTTKKPFVVITFLFFTFFPLALLFSHSFLWLVAAFILRGLKEFGEPTRKALIMDLAPEDCKAGMFGLYYLIRDVVVSIAAFGGAFLWMLNPAVNLLTAFAFGLLGTAWFVWKGTDLVKTT